MFDAESNISLVDSLKKKGINEVFDKNKADFSPISNTDLYCDSVIHSTKLGVDRKGIIGAAATVVMLGAASPFREEKIKVTEEFIVDRAFGYLVSDSSERVLFSGVINKI